MVETNTLVVCGIEKDRMGEVADHLKQSLMTANMAPVHWAPLKSFGRILAVFLSAADAANARGIITSTSNYKAFYSQNTPLEVDSEHSHLQLPDAGKLWLISPPPSPPASWVPRQEDEPNKETWFDHGSDDPFSPLALSQALLRAQSEVYPEQVGPSGKLTRRCTLHETKPLKLDTNVSSRSSDESTSTPTIVLEWDEDDDEKDPVTDSRSNSLPRTELPPV